LAARIVRDRVSGSKRSALTRRGGAVQGPRAGREDVR
jgi:hypothetical protein